MVENEKMMEVGYLLYSDPAACFSLANNVRNQCVVSPSQSPWLVQKVHRLRFGIDQRFKLVTAVYTESAMVQMNF